MTQVLYVILGVVAGMASGLIGIGGGIIAVSYTHLTLPTILRV